MSGVAGWVWEDVKLNECRLRREDSYDDKWSGKREREYCQGNELKKSDEIDEFIFKIHYGLEMSLIDSAEQLRLSKRYS